MPDTAPGSRRPPVHHHGRLDRAGVDRVAADVVVIHLTMDGDGLGHGTNRPFGRAIGVEHGIAEMCGRGAHVDDRTAPRILHEWNAVLASQEHAIGHDAQVRVELIEGCGLRGTHHHHARVVDEYMQAAEPLLDLCEHLLPTGLACHVLHHEKGALGMRGV
jgi:hypothetical protein